ncbi:hypothetical protein Taro_013082 [Colocasia esculenta]|uniref:Uncharacterized protein n=1 Tax=Colocasia esculenta TaxID=4460 RepID=A0A843UAW2_COLES|nr:hypothetical protein [Colocasia esculenta]
MYSLSIPRWHCNRRYRRLLIHPCPNISEAFPDPLYHTLSALLWFISSTTPISSISHFKNFYINKTSNKITTTNYQKPGSLPAVYKDRNMAICYYTAGGTDPALL